LDLFNDIDHHHQAARLDIVVGGVMRNVTVQHPLTCFCGNELDVIPFARRNADCIPGLATGQFKIWEAKCDKKG
jgi:hypothetical protein